MYINEPSNDDPSYPTASLPQSTIGVKLLCHPPKESGTLAGLPGEVNGGFTDMVLESSDQNPSVTNASCRNYFVRTCLLDMEGGQFIVIKIKIPLEAERDQQNNNSEGPKHIQNASQAQAAPKRRKVCILFFIAMDQLLIDKGHTIFHPPSSQSRCPRELRRVTTARRKRNRRKQSLTTRNISNLLRWWMTLRKNSLA